MSVEFKKCQNGHYYDVRLCQCPYCKTQRKTRIMRCNNCGWDNPDENQKCEMCGAPLEDLKSKLKDLSKEPPKFPPHENAMCYCQAPPSGWSGFDNDNDSGGNGLIRKILIILAIIAAVAIGIAIALI